MASQVQQYNTIAALVKLRRSTAPPPTTDPNSAALSSAAPTTSETTAAAPLPPQHSAFVWSAATDKILALFASQVDVGNADFAHIVEEIHAKDGVAPTVDEVSIRVGVLRQAARQKKRT